MVLPARTMRSALLNERLLLMRLITSVGLAFLLMLGIAAANHAEMDASAPEILTMNMVLDPHVDSVGVHAEHEASAEILSEPEALFGAAMCAFGVLCGLTLMVFARRLLGQRALPGIGRATRMRSVSTPFVVPPRRNVLSLTQLGLSRT